MKQIVLILVLCLLPLPAVAQSSTLSAGAAGFDCTPICGNPTCCIARKQAIPACSVTDRSSLSRLQRLAARRNSSEIVNICLGAARINGVNPIVDGSQAEALRKLSCKWGCCSRNQVLTSLKANPALGEKMFAGTALAAFGRQISEKGTVTPEAGSKISTAFAARKFQICIFCCTF